MWLSCDSVFVCWQSLSEKTLGLDARGNIFPNLYLHHPHTLSSFYFCISPISPAFNPSTLLPFHSFIYLFFSSCFLTFIFIPLYFFPFSITLLLPFSPRLFLSSLLLILSIFLTFSFVKNKLLNNDKTNHCNWFGNFLCGGRHEMVVIFLPNYHLFCDLRDNQSKF